MAKKMQLNRCLLFAAVISASNLANGQVVREVSLAYDRANSGPLQRIGTNDLIDFFVEKAVPTGVQQRSEDSKDACCAKANCCPPPCWEFQADAIFMTRDASPGQPLTTGIIPQWNVDQMEFNHQTGARISAARRINDRDQIEVNWLGLEPMRGAKSRIKWPKSLVQATPTSPADYTLSFMIRPCKAAKSTCGARCRAGGWSSDSVIWN